MIRRFSEDVDLTYDICELAPDLVGDAPDALPPSRSQGSRWTKEARKRLGIWVGDTAAPFLAEALKAVEPVTIYRYVGPNGELRENEKRVLAA